MTESKSARDVRSEIRDEIHAASKSGLLDFNQATAAHNIVAAFDIGTDFRLALFEKYYDSFDLYVFIQLLAALKSSVWTEIGEEPIDKLLELEAKATNDPFYRDLPPEILAEMLIDGNSIIEEDESGEDEEEDEEEEEPDYYLLARDRPEELFL